MGYKFRIATAYKAEARLRIHVQGLSQKCMMMGATVSSLDKVRDAIHILGLCPGLGRISFITPKWHGNVVEADLDTDTLDDQQIDQVIEAACQNLNTSLRAVETSELMMKTIEGLPAYNNQALAVIGTCPNCQGDEDEA